MTERNMSRRAMAAGLVGATALATSTRAANAQTPGHPVPWYSVRDYGATPNDATDDTVAFNNAITAAAGGSSGGVVLVPPGNYRISAALQLAPSGKQIDIVGAGREQTVITLTTTTAGLRFGVVTSSVPSGARGGRSGGFTLDKLSGGGTPPIPTLGMQVAGGSNRAFDDITILHCATGLQLDGVQNSMFDSFCVERCTTAGVTLDYGAGGNVFTNLQVNDCATNVLFRSTAPFAGYESPSDNKFFGGIIESQAGSTTTGVDHRAGQDQWFIGVRFGGGTSTKINMTHNGAATAPLNKDRSHNLHLLGCYFVDGTAIRHIADQATIHVTDCHFHTMDTAFRMGTGTRVEIDRYHFVGPIGTRYTAETGSTPEQDAIRHETFHPHVVTTPAASNLALKTHVGTAIWPRSTPTFQLETSGRQRWADGGAPDVDLRRSAASTLEVTGRLNATQRLGVSSGASGFALGSMATASGAPSGVVRKVQVYDSAGTAIGWIPVYTTVP